MAKPPIGFDVGIMVKPDWFFIVPATVIWVSSLVVTVWDFISLQGLVYHFGIVNAVGLLLFLAGFILRRIGKATLTKNYSYTLKQIQKHVLITFGIYKHIRHPIYLGAILYTMGTPLLFSSMYGFLITFGFIPFLLYRIRIEENLLIKEFGDVYLEYKKHTKKLIPYIY